MGVKVGEYVVNHRRRASGKSNYNLTRSYKVLLDLVTVGFFQNYRTKSIYVFGGIGAMMWALGAAFSVASLWSKYAQDVPVHRNPMLNIAIFLCVLGIQFLVLGLLVEIIIRIYFDSGHRKPYLFERKVGFE